MVLVLDPAALCCPQSTPANSWRRRVIFRSSVVSNGPKGGRQGRAASRPTGERFVALTPSNGAEPTARRLRRRGRCDLWADRVSGGCRYSPCSNPSHASNHSRRRTRPPIDVDAVPGLGRRTPLQVLVRPHEVVPEPEWHQRRVELVTIDDAPPIEPGLERAEEAFDATVLPGAVPFGGLMTDAEPGQREAEQPALEDRLVVGTDRPGFAVALDGVEQHTQEGDRSLVLQDLQAQAPARAVIEQAEDEVKPPFGVGLAGAVDTPEAIPVTGP